MNEQDVVDKVMAYQRNLNDMLIEAQRRGLKVSVEEMSHNTMQGCNKTVHVVVTKVMRGTM